MLVSIITPMYNSENTISRTIESVLSQTYTDWEMIIIDDCSTDKSPEIVKKYQQSDNRIRYYKKEEQTGVAKSRNEAIRLSRGYYLAFLDSDDIWKDNKLEKQIDFMEKNKAGFCYCACAVIDENGSPTGKVRNVKKYADYKILLKGNFIPCLTVVVMRSLFNGIEFPEIPHEDYAAWLSVLKKGVKAYGINEVLAYYRVNRKSVSSNKFKAALWTWDIYRKQEKIPLVKSVFLFLNYLVRAVGKRL